MSLYVDFNSKYSARIYVPYGPGLKGQPVAYSNQILRPSVRLSVCSSVRNSVPPIYTVQYLVLEMIQ